MQRKNRTQMLGDLYTFYSEVNGCAPPIFTIQQWSYMTEHRLKVEHEKLKEPYETKIRIQNE
jgi:hypothetical protein